MHALGVDLTDRAARAVVVSAEGALVRAAAAAGEPQDALRQVLHQLSPDGVSVVGIATDSGVAPAVRSSVQEVARDPVPQFFAAGAACVAAEEWKGAARGAQHAVCLLIGDRVLAGILLDGRPWLGAHGLAGSAAWLALNPVERQDYRRFGSLAAEVSSKGIARRLGWRIQAGDRSAVLDSAGDLESITAAHVYDGARTGDGVAISVVRDTARYIGMAVVNLAASIDPDIVVLGGEVATAGDLLLEPVRHECARRLPPAMVDRFHCEMSPLGDDGVAIGAARLAMLARA